MRTVLKEMQLYVYIDASNIKNALKSLCIDIDWTNLYRYITSTYKNTIAIKYFQGIDKNDTKNCNILKKLENIGYEIKSINRQAYQTRTKYKKFRCRNCGQNNVVRILPSKKILKSNIDVYLCSELMGDLLNVHRKTHAILFTCDGDYAEMIKNIIYKNKKVYVSVFATPYTHMNNYLSSRLKELGNIERFFLVNILNIKDKISKKKESYTEVELSSGKLSHLMVK